LFICEEASVDTAVHRLHDILIQATGLVVPSECKWKSEFPSWFSGKLKFCIKKKDYFITFYEERMPDYSYNKFAFPVN
jgi:hypothetical protein